MSSELDLWVRKNESNANEHVLMFARKVDLASTLDDGVTDTSVLEIMSRILDATDEESLFAAANAGTTPTKEFLNVPFMLKSDDVVWKRSRSEYIETGGFPWYALMRVTNLQTGEEQTLNGGGFSFVSTLWKLGELGVMQKYDEDGGMPLICEGKPAGRGTVVLLKPFKMARSATAKA